MDLPTLLAVLLALASTETPDIEQPGYEGYREGIEALAKLDLEVGRRGALVSPAVDPFVLATIQWYEGRLRLVPPDGDCTKRMSADADARAKAFKAAGKDVPEWVYDRHPVCPAKGPMQISYGPHFLVPSWPEGKQLELPVRISSDELREPGLNIRLGYANLWHRKVEADASAPATPSNPGVWFTAFGSGRVVRHSWLGWGSTFESRRRCALLTGLLEAAQVKPASWACGHEGTAVEEHTLWVVARMHQLLASQAPQRSAAQPAHPVPAS